VAPEGVAEEVPAGRPVAAPKPPDERPPRRRFTVTTFDSLGDPTFRWFFVSMFGWFASMNMQLLVRGFIVFELTGSFAALGLVSLANALPGLALSLPGGVIADRLSKKRVVQVGQVANMSVAALLAVLMLADLLIFEYLLACAVVQGAINALIMPSRQAMIPEIVSSERLMNAVALNTAGMNVMRLAAPAAGGVLLALVGPGWVYMAMAGLYGGSALFLVPVRNRVDALSAAMPSAPMSHHPTAPSGGFQQIVEGGRYILRDRIVFMILSVNLVIVLVSMPYQMMLPGFAKEVLDAGPDRLGLLMSLTGVGSLAGSLVIASMTAQNRGRVLLFSSLLLGISLLAFSASTIFWLTAGLMIIIGIGQAGRMSLSNVLLQAYTEPSYRGRVMSVYMLEFSLVSFGTFLVGVLANLVGVQMAIGLTGVALVAMVLYLLAFVPKMRNLP
jgi:MFS family permease